MGIKNLMKIINKYAPNSIKETNIENYKGKIFAIDTNLLIYKNVFAIRKNGYDIKNNSIIVTHIHSMLLKLIGLKKYGILAIFVFDGPMPKLKEKTMKKRKLLRKEFKKKYESAKTETDKKKYFYLKSDITEKEIYDCKELITIFGFPIIQSTGEADKDIACLTKINPNIYAVSEDMDILVFGATKLIRKFTVSKQKNKKMIEINLKKLLTELQFNQRMLVHLAILLGCDYCNASINNEQFGTITSYKMIKKYKYIKDPNIYNKIEKYFMSNCHTNLDIKIKEKNVNVSKLKEFLTKYLFKQEYIEKKLKILNI